jgi:hypothetical protein
MKSQFAQLRIFDVTGTRVAEVFNGKVNMGMHSFEWNASDFSSGIYFCRLETSSGSETKKMILLK